MRSTIVLIGLVSSIVWSSEAAQADRSAGDRVTCTAFAVSTGGPYSSPVATALDIVVERWSSDSERQRLLDALKRSQNAMLETLRELRRVGYIRTPTSLAWDLHYAQEVPGDEGGRRIVVATDRPISFWEAVNQPRTVDYPFTFIELQLNADGEGEGKLSVATQLFASSDGRFVQLESYAAQPVQLNEVKCR